MEITSIVSTMLVIRFTMNLSIFSLLYWTIWFGWINKPDTIIIEIPVRNLAGKAFSLKYNLSQ